MRPVMERVRDYAIVVGTSGSLFGACVAARHNVPVLGAAVTVGTGAAASAAAFVGLRHALIQDKWEQDVEAISGFAAGAVGFMIGLATGSARAGARLGMASFFVGGISHFAHRWWLHVRLQQGW